MLLVSFPVPHDHFICTSLPPSPFVPHRYKAPPSPLLDMKTVSETEAIFDEILSTIHSASRYIYRIAKTFGPFKYFTNNIIDTSIGVWLLSCHLPVEN
jgi:hypothetical protein